MSLTSELRNPQSIISLFIDTRLPDWKPYCRAVSTKLIQATTAMPTGPVSWTRVGMAIDYRIRYYFAVTPYEKLIAYKGTKRAIGTIDSMDDEDEREYCQWVFDLTVHPKRPYSAFHRAYVRRVTQQFNDAPPFQQGKAWGDFFRNLDRFLHRLSPVGRLLTPGDEELLARYCGVLAQFEAFFRSSRPEILEPLKEAVKDGYDGLLRVPTDAEVKDICALSTIFYQNHGALAKRSAVLNPTFAGSQLVGGADGDLIVEHTLIEIKTTKRPLPEKNWFRQLLGYVLLDSDNKHKITSIGLYLSRQGLLISWPLEEILRGLQTEGKAAGLSDALAQLRKGLSRSLTAANKGSAPEISVARLLLGGAPKLSLAGDKKGRKATKPTRGRRGSDAH